MICLETLLEFTQPQQSLIINRIAGSIYGERLK